MKRSAVLATFVAIGISLSIHAAEIQSEVTDKQEIHQGDFVPGMGEIMGLTQMRHSKLWFAGNARNWNLASYELDEIREGLEDAVKYHPLFKKDAPISAMLDKFMAKPLNDISKSIETKDRVKFRQAFDSLTNGCNACHQAASQGFIVMKRPRISAFNNQEFAVKAK